MSLNSSNSSDAVNQDPLGTVETWKLLSMSLKMGPDGKTIGLHVPGEKFYRFEDGEEMVFIKEGAGRKPCIRLGNGTIIDFDTWKAGKDMQSTAPSSYHPLSEKLDRTHLNEITQNALKQGSLFGKNFNLTPSDIEEIDYVIKMAEDTLAKSEKNPDWTKFLTTIADLFSNGSIFNMTNPPGWLIDGGADASVETVKVQNQAIQVRVPTSVYNLYFWKEVIRPIKNGIIRSQMLGKMTGTSPRGLGESLVQLASFLKTTGTIPQKI